MRNSICFCLAVPVMLAAVTAGAAPTTLGALSQSQTDGLTVPRAVIGKSQPRPQEIVLPYVRSISGGGESLYATVVFMTGDVVEVAVGDFVQSGYRVTSIGASEVLVMKDKKSLKLPMVPPLPATMPGMSVQVPAIESLSSAPAIPVRPLK